jgi:hypothetical protein
MERESTKENTHEHNWQKRGTHKSKNRTKGKCPLKWDGK